MSRVPRYERFRVTFPSAWGTGATLAEIQAEFPTARVVAVEESLAPWVDVGGEAAR